MLDSGTSTEVVIVNVPMTPGDVHFSVRRFQEGGYPGATVLSGHHIVTADCMVIKNKRAANQPVAAACAFKMVEVFINLSVQEKIFVVKKANDKLSHKMSHFDQVFFSSSYSCFFLFLKNMHFVRRRSRICGC